MSNIKVAVRVRPPIEREIKNGEEPIWRTSGNTIYTESGKNTLHTFDHVFHSSSTNQEVYEKCCHPLVESVMLGFNGTIFAFGQTSSGKTHTMMGNSSQPGLIPLTIDAIFDIIQNMPEREYLLRISYMEIYNENVLDLLDDSYGKHLQIRDNADGQPVISDLTEVTVGSKEEIESVMTSGERRRHVASTEANQRSSRSHTIFRMVIESSVRGGTDDAVTVGQLNLVDLAGSERSEQCGDMGERFRESTRINVSLTFLTQVISKLSRGERGHINFRDSKLTRILRNSLGGNAHTAIVCTVNPCCMEQTLRTLQFASSAKKIQNTPKVNEILTNEALIRRYHKQIEVLNRQLKATEGSSLCKTIQEKNSQIYELKSKVSSLERKLLVSSIPQKRKQRRETWAAPRRTDSVPEPLVCPLSQMGTPLSYVTLDSPDMVRGRLSTVVEESESFLAIPYDQFERQLQREERIRRSAVLSSRDTTPDCLNACCSATCSERIAFLESELAILRKEHQELKELTTLEQLLCSTSRRPTSSEKQAESMVQDLPCESVHTSPPHTSSEKVDPVLSTPLSSLNECCIQTLLASRRHLKRESSAAFFSPIAASPALAKHDSSEASSAATSPDICPSRESLQAPGLHTPRTVLWTPKNSPAVCMNATPVDGLKTVYACKPLCFARSTQTDDMPCQQACLHVATQSVQTEDCGTSQQVHTSAVDAMCQTDSEDICEMPKPLTFELLSGAEHLDHSTMNVSYSEKPLMKSAEVQTTGSSFSILEEQPGRPELTDAAVSCCMFFEQFVECGVQTEACAREFTAMELMKQEVACVPACAAGQVPVERAFVQSCSVQTSVITKDSESQINTSLTDDYRADLGTQTLIPSSACSGVQAIPDTEDCSSQVNTSLAEDYRTDFGVHVVADMLSCASQVDVQFTRKWATDCAVQCELLAENSGSETSGRNTVDCWVQATVLVQECAAQTQCLLQCDFTDSGVQVIPSMQDCATQHEPSIGEMLQCAVQTSPRSVCDNFTQHECSAPPAAVTTTPHSCSLRLCDEVRPVSLTRSSLSQVKESLTPQESSASKISNTSVTGKMRRTFCVKNILAGRPGGFKPPEVPTPTLASESARPNQSRYPCGDMNALGASQPRYNEYGEHWASSAGHQKAADYTSPAVRTTAFVTKPWLQRSEMVTQGKESVAVQADIWTTQGMNYKDHLVEKYKKALQELESQHKLQEKAAKKREIQLKAAIRELKNKDVDTRVRASHENPPATPATSTESEAPQQPEAVALAAESPTSFARRLKAMTPISREGARLIYFGQSLKERALAEEVQRAQLKASLSSHTQRLASAQRRHQAWAERRCSHTADADPRSPLKEQNQKTVRESSPDSAKDEVLAEMACWPPMKFVMDYKENLDSP